MPKYANIEKGITIGKTRRLPAPGEVLVHLGDAVKEDTPIARGRVRNPEIIELRVDQKLGVDPFNLSGYMLKKEGDPVKKDEVIALRRSFFGTSTKICRSPLDGTIEAFSHSSGKVLIRGEPIPIEVRAHIPGRVTELFPGEGAAVECRGSIARGAIGAGGETHGPLEVLVDNPDEVLTNGLITKTHSGKVIIGGATATPEALRKAQSAGASAVIVGGIDEKDLTELIGHELDLGDTGQEKIGFTLVALGGFGANPMDEEAFQLFKEHAGRLACVDGTTQIRTRMLRPEVILPS
ncbi:MAG: hypothetical protein NTV61_03825 [Candidatus Bathyarchaeota archaeon]|nr:hypothetical protein [Candidatus Bathyarchaeota archaeon]